MKPELLKKKKQKRPTLLFSSARSGKHSKEIGYLHGLGTDYFFIGLANGVNIYALIKSLACNTLSSRDIIFFFLLNNSH